MDLLDCIGNLVLIGLIVYVVLDWSSRVDAVAVVNGKRVVITGASRGIGEQLAYYYARCGASLVLAARDGTKLQKVVETCKEIGHSSATFHYISVDYTDMSSAEKTIQFAKEKMGGLDILTLNHAYMIPREFWGTGSSKVEHLDGILKINFQSFVHLTCHALPLLEESNGYLCVIGSLAARMAVPLVAHYNATKFALDGFFSSLRQELMLQGKKVSITFALLGFVGSENAKEIAKDIMAKAPEPAPPMEAATAIVAGTVKRSREIHFPLKQGVPITLFLYGLLPGVLTDFLVVRAFS